MTELKTFGLLDTTQLSRSATIGNVGGHMTERREKLAQACRDFESVFVNYMMQQMRRTVPQDGLFDGGKGEEMFTSMLDGEMAKSISSHQGLGLASVLFQQLAAQVPEEK